MEPPGVNTRRQRRKDEQPDPAVSLLEYHRFRLDRARGRGAVAHLVAITEAEKDAETSVRRPPSYLADAAQNAEDRDAAILRWEGRRPEAVAVWEDSTFSNVRRVRMKYKRDPMTGYPREAESAA
jgi:hypothetical protein